MSNRSTATRERRRLASKLAWLTVALVAWPAATAEAQTTRTWSGATNATWTTTTNWSGGAIPGSTDTVRFDSTSSNLTTTTGSTFSLNGLQVVDPSGLVTIGGSNSLTIGAGGIDMSAATQDLTILLGVNGTLLTVNPGTFNIAAGRTLSLGVSAGTLPVRFNSGTTTLTGGGRLSITNQQGEIRSGATLRVQSGTFSAGNNFQLSSGGVLLNEGGVVSLGAFIVGGTFSQSAGSSTVSDFRTNSPIFVSGGTATFTFGSSTYQAAGSTGGLTVSGGQVTIPSWTAFASGSGANNFVLLSGGTMTMNSLPTTRGANSTSTFTFDGGVLRAGSTTTSFMPQSLTNAYVTNNGALIDTNAKDITIGQSLTNGTAVDTSGSLVKTGSGTLTLSGSNGYTGTTRVTTGSLALGNINALAGSTLDMNGSDAGTVTFTVSGTNTYNIGGLVGSRNIVTSGSSILGIGGNGTSGTYSGVISGAGGLSKSGGGTLTLAGANSYTGATTVLGGTLATSVANVIPDASRISVAEGATFRTGGSDTAGSISGAGTIDLAATLILGTWSSQTLTVSGLITGSGGLSANTGSGWLAITGSNNNSGGYTARAGTTYVGNDYAFGSGILNVASSAGAVVASVDSTTRTIGNTLTWGGFDHYFGTSTTGDLVFTGAIGNAPSGNKNIFINNARTQFDQGLGPGAGGRIKYGPGMLIIGGASTYTGVTTINSGTLQLGRGGTDGTLSTSSAISGSAGGTLAFNRTNAIVQGTDFTATGISGGMGLAQIGTGTLTLSSSNSYSGGTVLSAGQLNINHLNAIGTGTFTISGGSIDNTSAGAITLATNNPQVWNADFTFVGTRNLNLGTGAVTLSADRRVTTSSGTLTVGGAIGGAFGLTKAGGGALVMGGAGTYSGDTTISDGSLLLGANNAIPNGSLVVLGTGSTAGTLVMNGFDDTMRGLVFNGNGSQVANTNGGKLALVGSGTNPATITVNSGSHALHPDTTLGSDTTIDVAAESFFSLHGVIDGSKSLTKLGSGTMTIFGGNTYTGGVFITNGFVSAQNSTALGTGTVTISGNSILNLNNYVIDNPIVFASGSGAVINSGTLVAISGTGTIDSGTGTTITTNYSVLGSGSFAFASTVGAQVNVQSDAMASFSEEIAAGGDVKILVGGRGTFNGAMNGTVTTAGVTTFGAAVNSNVTVTGGTATFSGTSGTDSAINTTAGTSIFNGTIGGVAHATQASATSEIRGNVLSTADVRAENGGTVKLLGSGSFVAAGLFNGGSVIIDRDANLDLAAAISGTGSLTKLNGTTLTLTGNNTYSGLTIISGGTLSVGNGGASGVLAGNVLNNAALVFNRSDNSSFSGSVAGTGSLAKLGGGLLALSGSSNYSGATVVSGGRLTIESAGSLNGTSGISVNGAEFRYNSAATLAATITFGGSAGTLSGTGTIGSALTVGTNAILSPGNSPGTQAFAGGLTWAPGGTYVWELKSLTGAPGTDWDLLSVSGGTFDISALTTENRFNLNLVTLNGSNSPGPLDIGYVAGASYEFQIASFATLGSGTYGFGANSDLTSLFTIDLAGWQGPQPSLGDMSVRVNSAGNAIQLVIVPEPGAIFLVGIGAAFAGWWRLRRRAV